ncbi:MAG: D-aminoacylase [Clostridiaceae bacterium]|nr:D-aminoacylase [Clostridiaceae bacterium]
MYDLLIHNCRVIDGSGSPSIHSDVAIQAGKIAAVGQMLGAARETLDGGGRCLAPGFIDSHSHNDLIVEQDPAFAGALEQGITTQIAGQCGESPAPLSEARVEDTLRVCGADGCVDPTRRFDFGVWLSSLPPMGVNTAFLVGHGNLRAAAMGFEDRNPTPAELSQMEAALRCCLEGGAMGISFGLIYPPGVFSETPELIALAKITTEYGGMVTAHMRSENIRLLPALREMLEVARESRCRTVISHHKATGGPRCWNQTADTLPLMDAANGDGLDVYCDQYPYTASATGLSTDIPDEFHALPVARLLDLVTTREGRDRLRPRVLNGKTPDERFAYTMIGTSDSHPELCGKMLLTAARELSQDPYELLMDLLRDDRLSTGGIFHTMSEEDVERVMRWPRAMVGTDGIMASGGAGGHPRSSGTFPRILARYVRERGILTLENAIRKMTSLPAQVYNLKGKGLIRPGMDADLVLFDPDTIADNATFVQPKLRPSGIDRVWVHGVSVVENGAATGALAGTVLRRHNA